MPKKEPINESINTYNNEAEKNNELWGLGFYGEPLFNKSVGL